MRENAAERMRRAEKTDECVVKNLAVRLDYFFKYDAIWFWCELLVADQQTKDFN